jgi:hypothetical protein
MGHRRNRWKWDSVPPVVTHVTVDCGNWTPCLLALLIKDVASFSHPIDAMHLWR